MRPPPNDFGHLLMLLSMLMWMPQSGTEAVLELELERVFPQMFREYIFVASNHVGTSRHTISLVKGLLSLIHVCKG